MSKGERHIQHTHNTQPFFYFLYGTDTTHFYQSFNKVIVNTRQCHRSLVYSSMRSISLYVTLSFNTPIELFLLQSTTPFDRIVELLVKEASHWREWRVGVGGNRNSEWALCIGFPRWGICLYTCSTDPTAVHTRTFTISPSFLSHVPFSLPHFSYTGHPTKRSIDTYSITSIWLSYPTPPFILSPLQQQLLLLLRLRPSLLLDHDGRFS